MLGVNAQADAIATRNLRDVAYGELKFPSLRVLTPEQCLEIFPCPLRGEPTAHPNPSGEACDYRTHERTARMGCR